MRKLIPPSKDIGLAGFMRVLLVLGIAAGVTWFPSVCMIQYHSTELWQLLSPPVLFQDSVPSCPSRGFSGPLCMQSNAPRYCSTAGESDSDVGFSRTCME